MMICPLNCSHGQLWKRIDSTTGRIFCAKNVPDTSTSVNPQFTCISFDSKGENFVCTDMRGTLFLFKIKNNRYIRVKRIGKSVTALQYSNVPKSSNLLVGLSDKSIHYYGIGMNKNILNNIIDSQKHIATLKGHQYQINNFSFHPSGSTVLSCSKESVILWDLHSLKKLKTLSSRTVGLTQVILYFNNLIIGTFYSKW